MYRYSAKFIRITGADPARATCILHGPGSRSNVMSPIDPRERWDVSSILQEAAVLNRLSKVC